MSKRVRTRFLGTLLILLGAGVCASAQAGRLVWGDCPTLSNDSGSAARMQCGWLDTGTLIDGRPVRLRVVMLRARPDRRSARPVIYIPGGPGDSAGLSASGLVAWRRFQQRAGWPADLVLFDPRGTGESQPRPACPVRRDGAHGARRQAVTCYQALGERTADALGPTAQIHDIVTLIDALDVDSATLWAVSYGTRIARGVAADAPQIIRALVLDSPVYTLRSATADQRAVERRAVTALLAYCRTHLACRLAVPSARSTIEGLLAAAAEQPRSLAWADIPRRPWVTSITPARLLSMIVLAGYRPVSSANTIRRLQHAARTGGVAALSPLAATLGSVVENRGHSRAVYAATRCAYERSSHAPRPARDGAFWLDRYLAPLAGQSCGRWPVAAVRPVSGPSELSILLLNGGRDIVTPAARSAPAIRPDRHRTAVLIPDAGHAPTLTDRCAQEVVAGFLPARGTDTDWMPSCGVVLQRGPLIR